jgi:hypothetical protein
MLKKLFMSLFERKLNYTGLFFDKNTFPEINKETHMTWNFGTPLIYPDNVKKDTESYVTVIGYYEDEDVSCYIVEYEGIQKQPKGTLLHITIETKNGVPPVQSGLRATKNGYKKIDKFQVLGIWR